MRYATAGLCGVNSAIPSVFPGILALSPPALPVELLRKYFTKVPEGIAGRRVTCCFRHLGTRRGRGPIAWLAAASGTASNAA